MKKFIHQLQLNADKFVHRTTDKLSPSARIIIIITLFLAMFLIHTFFIFDTIKYRANLMFEKEMLKQEQSKQNSTNPLNSIEYEYK